MGQSLGNIVVAAQKSGFYCGEKKATEKKDHPGLSSAFNLDFIDCGNQPERAFPFPVPTCLAPSVCLESSVWLVRRVSPRKVSPYEAHATCFLGAGNCRSVLLLHHLAFQRKPCHRLAHSLCEPREGGDHGSGERRIS